jgi:hypothetical protein
LTDTASQLSADDAMLHFQGIRVEHLEAIFQSCRKAAVVLVERQREHRATAGTVGLLHRDS